MAYQGFNITAFARSSATTLAHHVKDVEEAMLRNFQIGALLEANGRVNFSNTGEGFDWPVQYRLHTVEGNTGETARNFVRRNLWQNPYLDFRGYQTTDSMYYKEFLSNKGPEGIVKVFDNFTTRLDTSMKQALGTEFYVDGSASGNEEMWNGLESMFVDNGTVNVATGAQRTANVLDKVAYPNDTYAGLTTGLGDYGGEIECGNIWPEGIADPEFDFWSPLIVNYGSSAFGGSSSFATQGDECLRYGIIHSQRNQSTVGGMTNIILARDLYFDFLNLIDSKERIQISEENSLRALGFKNTVQFDGIEVSWEIGVPSTAGYGINWKSMELKSMDSTLLRSEGPEYDLRTQAFNAVVSTISNLKFDSPRNFVHWDNLA